MRDLPPCSAGSQTGKYLQKLLLFHTTALLRSDPSALQEYGLSILVQFCKHQQTSVAVLSRSRVCANSDRLEQCQSPI